jgi:hypothetical protein
MSVYRCTITVHTSLHMVCVQSTAHARALPCMHNEHVQAENVCMHMLLRLKSAALLTLMPWDRNHEAAAAAAVNR